MWRSGIAAVSSLGRRSLATSTENLVRVGYTSGILKQLGEGKPAYGSIAVKGLSVQPDKDAALKELSQDKERYAMVGLAGRQFKVVENDVIVCNKLKDAERRDVKVGDRILLDEVLLVGSNGPILFGLPIIEQSMVSVTATVIEQLKSEKNDIVKKKRRKNYKRTFGHRQELTALRINSIDVHPAGAAAAASAQ